MKKKNMREKRKQEKKQEEGKIREQEIGNEDEEERSGEKIKKQNREKCILSVLADHHDTIDTKEF